jgi:hypothetical protein
MPTPKETDMKLASIIKPALLFIASILPAVACADEAITGEALKALHMDKTFEMTQVNQAPGRIYFSPDGTVTLIRSGRSRVGKWWIDDSGAIRCNQFGTGKPFCVSVKSAGNGKYVAFDEQGVAQIDIHKVMDGNALAD